jgi:2-polyprenyl-3-methyl-5-hydroxy-6-metoxy-1,4-benzoquinol methylase
MYFQIAPTDPDGDFSWIIAKNPNSPPYERQIGGASSGRRVVGSFKPDGSYEVVVHNDGLMFFNEMRARNEAAYVRPEPWLVCPSNLKGINVALKSALNGDFKGISQEKFFAPKNLRAVIGPFPLKAWNGFFEDLGFNVEVPEEGTTEARTLILTTKVPMSVTVFLQKIYISMMAFTARWAFYDKVEDAQIDRYLELTKEWIGALQEQHRQFIINRLTGYKKSLQARWASSEEAVEKKDAEEAKDATEAKYEAKVSLHQKRHELILANLPADPKKIVDLGSGEGKLLAKLLEQSPEAEVLGVEARRERMHRTRRALRGANQKVKLIHDNLLFPRAWADLSNADVLIASEVIEHLGHHDRRRFVRLIAELLEPKVLFLTTPNIEANELVFGMPPGMLRHDDHRIEYTKEQFESEVVRPLSAFYDVTYLDVLPGEAIQPSFCIKAVRKAVESSPGKDYIRYGIERMSHPSYFATTNVTVGLKDMREGYTSHPFLENAHHIFYLGPTIAPVDYISDLEQYLAGASEGGPYLEHPLAAFQYYYERGIRTLVEEPKYMGSRSYALIFRDQEQARRHGLKYPILMNARSGGAFFRDPAKAMPIWEDVAPKMQDDFMILDMEVMPWSLKADKLIANDFTLPGEAALLWRRRHQPELASNAGKFLDMVKTYGGDTPLEVRVFHLLAAGKVTESKKNPDWLHYYDTRYGFYRSHYEQLKEISAIAGDIVKPAGYEVVQLGIEESKAASVHRWMAYCADGGEGFVYKPFIFHTLGETGYPLQPALKVRGKDYLRIIYGMDYLQPEYFDRLKQRGTKMKRLLAVQEQEIAMQILRCFINGNEIERLRAIGAFLGLEFAEATTIDKTL